jgi:transcriptional regulator with XRE-family HTH domain
MASRQSNRDRGRKRGRDLTQALIRELIHARRTGGVSQATLARQLGVSQSEISRLERLVRLDDVALVRLTEAAAVLGFDLSAGLHPNGDRVADRGHQALIARFIALLSPIWRVAREVPLPLLGDRRSWDLLLRLPGQLVGVELETRIRDIQHLVRRIRDRERDGGADVIVLVLSDSAANRRLLTELLEALGEDFATAPRAVLAALRVGRALPGSGVVLL